MKRGRARKESWGEGWLVAAALGLTLALSLVVYIARVPLRTAAAPVHGLDYAELRRVEMVDINSDSAEEISRLPGVGEVLAERIVAYREEHGPFESAEELLDVEGIGEGKLEVIRDEIYVD